MLLLAMLGPATSRLASMGLFVLFGIGMGFLMQITTLIAQNSVSPADMGVASSSRSFFQQIGGSIGVSIFGVVFFRALRDSLAAHLPSFKLNTSGGGLDPAQVQHFAPAVRHAVYVGIAHGLDLVFIWAAPTAAIVFAIGWLVKEIPLRGRADATPGKEQQPQPEPVLVD